MEPDLQDGAILTLEELAALAKRVRKEAGDKQEETAAKLEVNQAQVSKAENGNESYSSLCVRMIRLYTSYDIEHPLYRLARQ